MITLHFSTHINVSPKVVWETLMAPQTFRIWASEFAPDSYFEGCWEEGEPIRFVTPDGSGMISRIAENRPYEFLSIMHRGIIHEGKEDTDSPEVKAWAPAFENYQLVFHPDREGTELKIAMDVSEGYEDCMKDAWPRALQRLKTLCEEGE